MAELALQGRIVEVPEVLFFRRTAPGGVDPAGRAPPAGQLGRSPPGAGFLPLTMLIEYASVVRDADLTPLDRLRCYGVVAHKAVGSETWGRMLVPGPRNYLGWRS